MLADVLAAVSPVGEPVVVTGDPAGAALAHELGAQRFDDPGGGQGPAVAAALAAIAAGPALVVNADLPCAVPADVLALLVAVPAQGIALVEAPDGTTNALGLSSPALFAPLYGPGSARRFGALRGETVERRDPEPRRGRRHARRPRAAPAPLRAAHAGVPRRALDDRRA